MANNDEKQLFGAKLQVKAPFIGGWFPVHSITLHFKSDSANAIGLGFKQNFSYVIAYEDRLVIHWGLIRQKQMEIPLSSITSFEIDDLETLMPGEYWKDFLRSISFREKGKVMDVIFFPGFGCGYTYLPLTKHLRAKIPSKEIKGSR